jgi:HEAT repeat protein
MLNCVRSSRAHRGVTLLVLLASATGCSQEEHRETVTINEATWRQETPSAGNGFQESAEARPEYEVASGHTEEIQSLIAQLASVEAPKRAVAARRLGNLGPAAKQAIPELLKLLTDDTPLGIGQAVYRSTSPGQESAVAIARIAPDRALSIFSPFLQSDTSSTKGYIRTYISYALGEVCLPGAIDILLEMLQVEQGESRRNVLAALSCFQDKRVVKAMIAEVRNGTDYTSRIHAVQHLGSQRDSLEAKEALREFAESDEMNIRIYAREGLEKMN